MPTNDKALATTGETAATVFDTSFLPDMTDLRDIMQENMEGIDFKFEKIKVPSGGGISWEVPTEDGEIDSVKEVTGVIIDHHPINAWWESEYTGENNPPDCSSMDGVTGKDQEGNVYSCASCPRNQWGSDPDGGRGKACKNMRRVYLVREGEAFPYLVTVPPTSLENHKLYMHRLTSKMRPATSVLTKLTLEKAKSEGGILYSQIVFSRADDLDKDAAGQMREFAKIMKPYLRQIAITGDEYGTDNTGDSDVDTIVDGVIDVEAAEEGKAW